MDQAILINDENEENKQYQVEISVTIQQEQQEQHEKSNSNQACNLCDQQNIPLLNYSTLERELNICQFCNDTINSFQKIDKQNLGTFQDCKYSKEIEIEILNQGKFYNLEYGECNICSSPNTILIKLNFCKHYCCDLCLSFYINLNNANFQKLMCPFQNCKFEINDYLTFQLKIGINFHIINFVTKKNAKQSLFYNLITICSNQIFFNIIISINVECVKNSFVEFVGQSMMENVILISSFKNIQKNKSSQNVHIAVYFQNQIIVHKIMTYAENIRQIGNNVIYVIIFFAWIAKGLWNCLNQFQIQKL
ncbi:unnamed protein product [Paramecium sonneborni]|uniref:RING-type domain-containing protein n=1 Tax=Paramecium sonneborni TaxID=65129 RepID=A0A8S1QZD6_9CILI|nr:unnamed protein product [Paramecium sonneborni]